MSADKAATIFCCTPKRVTLAELERLRAEEALAAPAPVPTVPSCAPSAALALPTLQCSAPPIPNGPCPVCPRLDAEFEPWRQAAFYKSMHQKAKQRERLLQEENQQLQARIRYLEQQLYGNKTESAKSAQTTPAATTGAADATQPRRRGQQSGKPGPTRRDYSHLPGKDEFHDLADDEKHCSCCGLPFVPFPGTEDSEILEVEVKAYRRVIHRRRYRPTCSCGEHPGIITAPPAPRVIPKSIPGVSIWVEVLLDKFLFYRPTYRLLLDWQTHDLDLSLGTLTDGLQRLLPLFEPLYEDLVEHNQQQTHWHSDETRWLVFATLEGKVGYRWWLWVFHCAEAVVFVLSQGRAHDVPEEHFGPVQEGILSVDRYAAYKAMKQVKEGLILLAFCWAHVRRDFLQCARSWPSEEQWALGWVERIGLLYKANDARLLALQHEPETFAALEDQLRQQVEQMAAQAAQELTDDSLHPARQRVLQSLEEHWDGLTVFVDFPEVPMDNNRAERAERGPVVLRKNSYGSGAVWSGQLAAMLFSVFQTLCLWNINPRVWLTEYLQTCARAGGRAPTEGERAGFLPWRMSAEKRQEWSLEKEKQGEDSS
jgi:transposase